MSVDLQKMKVAAEAAAQPIGNMEDRRAAATRFLAAQGDFYATCTPRAILDLIAEHELLLTENRMLRAESEQLRQACQQHGEALRRAADEAGLTHAAVLDTLRALPGS